MKKRSLLALILSAGVAGHAAQAGKPVARSHAARQAKPAGGGIFVSRPDLALRIPNVNVNDARYSIHIDRRFLTRREDELLRKAEATYPPKARVLSDSAKTLARLNPAARHSKALWWWGEFDGVRLPYAITGGAVSYYLNQIQQFRHGNFRGSNGIKMVRAHLDYTASLRREKAFLLNKRVLRNVYVVTLRLSWSQDCGRMCGMSFDRARTVVLAPDGTITVDGDGAKGVRPD